MGDVFDCVCLAPVHARRCGNGIFSLRGNAEDRPCIDEAWLRSLEFMNLDIGINVFIWWRK